MPGRDAAGGSARRRFRILGVGAAELASVLADPCRVLGCWPGATAVEAAPGGGARARLAGATGLPVRLLMAPAPAGALRFAWRVTVAAAGATVAGGTLTAEIADGAAGGRHARLTLGGEVTAAAPTSWLRRLSGDDPEADVAALVGCLAARAGGRGAVPEEGPPDPD
jgi:hypothetical protein